VVVETEWEYPEPADAEDKGEPVRVFRPVWIVTDPEAAGLVQRWTWLTRNRQGGGNLADDDREAAVEQAREERRTVIANNKAWVSAETVRRAWLRDFFTRKTPPKGAEALICEAVVGGQFTLSKAMDSAHPLLRDLLGVDTPSVYGAGRSAAAKLAASPANPKAATMTTLAAVVAAWEDSTGKQTWRQPSAWDGRVLAALSEWGYQPSEVERLLTATLTEPPTGHTDENGGDLPEPVAI